MLTQGLSTLVPETGYFVSGNRIFCCRNLFRKPVWTGLYVSRFVGSADPRLKEHRDALAVIEKDGSVLWIPPAIFSSSCRIDITNFPFDTQVRAAATAVSQFSSKRVNVL